MVLPKLLEKCLEELSDMNYFKPVVWAQEWRQPDLHHGVSLGVRTFVRPLYLYIKLNQLKNVQDGSNADIILDDLSSLSKC